MAHNIYKDFSEVEESIRQSAPPTLYKYRKWSDPYHRRLLTEREAWFAHPFTLNDPKDLRRPINVNTQGYDTPAMFEKLLKAGKQKDPDYSHLQLVRETMGRWAELQANPSEYFLNNMNELYNDYHFYSRMGLFSVSMNGNSHEMWSSIEYTDNYKGFCLGFDTVELARDIQCFITEVEYTDEELEVKIIDGLTDEHQKREVGIKYPKWSFEEEFRFLLFDVINEERARIFSPKAISEVLIGYAADAAVKDEIIQQTRMLYGSDVPIYIVSQEVGRVQRTLVDG